MKKTDTRYNGWTNRATWAVNLWLTNDEDHYRAGRNYTLGNVHNPFGFALDVTRYLRNWDHIVDDCDGFEGVNGEEILESFKGAILDSVTGDHR